MPPGRMAECDEVTDGPQSDWNSEREKSGRGKQTPESKDGFYSSGQSCKQGREMSLRITNASSVSWSEHCQGAKVETRRHVAIR